MQNELLFIWGLYPRFEMKSISSDVCLLSDIRPISDIKIGLRRPCVTTCQQLCDLFPLAPSDHPITNGKKKLVDHVEMNSFLPVNDD